MKNNRLLIFCLFVLGVVFMSSCVTTHPNAKLIVGKWKPESVEKYIDPNAVPEPQTAASGQPGANAAQPVKAKAGDSSRSAGAAGGAQAESPEQRMGAALDRLIRSEQRADFEVYDNGKAVKMYYPKPLKVKWKMKSKGTRVVAKELEGDRKFVIDILEITETRCVIIEHTRAGDLKIAYIKQ
jgi:hypothetical protein